MTYEEAMQAVADGKRVRSPTLSQGWVVKLSDDGERARVVNEATGSSFDFINNEAHRAAEWHLVEGWVSYAN